MERRVENAERLAEEARLATHPDDTDTVVERGVRPAIGLSRGARVTFRLPGGGEVMTRVEDGRLHVMSTGRISGRLHVIPQASNVVLLEVEDR